MDDDQIAAVTWDDMARFSHIEHPENVALALRVCADLGVARDVALRGMWQAEPDPGVMNLFQLDDCGRRITFVNGFAARDPDTTGRNWHTIVDRFPLVERHIALVNCRADRPDRAAQLAEACVRWTPADHYVLIGSATEIFARRARAMGLDARRLACAERLNTAELFEALRRRSGRASLVMGMGDITSPGFDLIDYFRQRSRRGHCHGDRARKQARRSRKQATVRRSREPSGTAFG